MRNSTITLAEGILRKGCRSSLARAITLIESSSPSDQPLAAELLELLSSAKMEILPTMRIGIAGPPGAGKSTFIEKLGKEFITNPVLQSKIHATSNHRVAVLPIDPSSSMTGGSILGDKTRMGFLATTRDAFVRPAASRCILGGLAEHTRDVIALCEAAGYNIVVVETVGLGQSEIDVDLAVDMVILLVSPGGGDSLQAAKKGIMEIADLIHTAADYSGSLQFLRQKHSGSKWRPQVVLASALTDYHIAETAEKILHFFDIMRAENRLQIRRQQQDVHWLQRHIQRGLLLKMQQNKLLQSEIRDTEKSVFRDANM
eukprot:gene30700-39984_t